MDIYHYPVLKNEVLKFWVNTILLTKKEIIIVDATCGEGGHSLALLEKAQKENWLLKLKLICLDQDQEILKLAKKRLTKYKNNTIFINANFKDIELEMEKLGIKKVNGILLDLGISTYHYKKSGRGFSFNKSEPLDMRLDKNQKLTAEVIINTWNEKDLEKIFKDYGEERFSRRIARFITEKRKLMSIKTSHELAEIIKSAIPRKFWPKHIHPATKIFQALRIAVNQELENLKQSLEKIINILTPKGRILVISFHSLEDRIVKKYFKNLNLDKLDDIYGRIMEEAPFDILTKKPICASSVELAQNPASRSAKLRIVQRR